MLTADKIKAAMSWLRRMAKDFDSPFARAQIAAALAALRECAEHEKLTARIRTIGAKCVISDQLAMAMREIEGVQRQVRTSIIHQLVEAMLEQNAVSFTCCSFGAGFLDSMAFSGELTVVLPEKPEEPKEKGTRFLPFLNE